MFHEQYISQPCIKSSFKVKCSIMNNPFRYGYGYYQMLAEVFEEFNDYDPFCGVSDKILFLLALHTVKS